MNYIVITGTADGEVFTWSGTYEELQHRLEEAHWGTTLHWFDSVPEFDTLQATGGALIIRGEVVTPREKKTWVVEK